MNSLPGAKVLGLFVNAVGWDEAQSSIVRWAHARESRYVCICNAHVTVSASLNSAYRRVLHGSDMNTPDGAPVAWMLRRLGFAGQTRVDGPGLTWALCKQCEEEDIPVFFFGSSDATLEKLLTRLKAAFPRLRVAAEAPPFRALSAEEDAASVARINDFGAGIVFVGLGCPKQENWMAAHRGHINATMIGVGAAFDFHAGTLKRAPLWMRKRGLEWLHRLLSEPQRLWKRYLFTNTLFLVGVFRQLVLMRVLKTLGSSVDSLKPANVTLIPVARADDEAK